MTIADQRKSSCWWKSCTYEVFVSFSGRYPPQFYSDLTLLLYWRQYLLSLSKISSKTVLLTRWSSSLALYNDYRYTGIKKKPFLICRCFFCIFLFFNLVFSATFISHPSVEQLWLSPTNSVKENHSAPIGFKVESLLFVWFLTLEISIGKAVLEHHFFSAQNHLSLFNKN